MNRALGPRPSLAPGGTGACWAVRLCCWGLVALNGIVWAAARIAAQVCGGSAEPFGIRFASDVLHGRTARRLAATPTPAVARRRAPARLPAAWHHQPVRRLQHRRRHRHQPVAPPPPRDRVQEVHDRDRQGGARNARGPLGMRQLHHHNPGPSPGPRPPTRSSTPLPATSPRSGRATTQPSRINLQYFGRITLEAVDQDRVSLSGQ